MPTFFEFFPAQAGTERGLGVTTYSPRGEVFSSDYVAFVMGLP